MSAHELRSADRIVRKDHIPDSERTEERDDVADWIDEHAADEWRKWTFTDIADELGFTRQHISNTVKTYYRPAGHEEDAEELGQLSERDLRIYRRGYRDGYEDARRYR